MKKVRHFLYQNPVVASGIICAIFLLTTFFVFRAMKADKFNDHDTVQESKQDGYELQPAYVKIEASRSKMLSDASDEGWFNGLRIVGWIFCFLPFVSIRFFGDLEKRGSAIALFVSALLWFTVTFAPFAAFSTRVEYETKICLKDYQEGKNYDYLFPAVSDQTTSLGDFLKSCK